MEAAAMSGRERIWHDPADPTEKRDWTYPDNVEVAERAFTVIHADSFRAAPFREKCRFTGTSDAGGGTRTPDTRIMIPLL
jgi:hypothetical protein